jgi:hypothetical protein
MPVQRWELTLPWGPRARTIPDRITIYVRGLTRNSGGIAMFSGADRLEKGLGTICTSWPRCKSTIARRLAGFSAYNTNLAPAINTIFTVSEKRLMCLQARLHVRWCLALIEN